MTNEEAKDYIKEWCPYDRQEEIIEALSNSDEDCISRADALKGLTLTNNKDDVYRMIRELSSVQPKERWIYVSERLPNHDEYIKNNGLFIVSDGNRSYSLWFDIYCKRRFGEPTMNGFRVDKCVTAWMSLPEPCKIESEDNNDK